MKVEGADEELRCRYQRIAHGDECPGCAGHDTEGNGTFYVCLNADCGEQWGPLEAWDWAERCKTRCASCLRGEHP